MSAPERSVFATMDVFERWDNEYYPPVALWYYDRAVSDMLRLLQVQPGETVLDAGCGPGVHSIRVARAGHSVHAIDISAPALAEAKRRAEQAGVADRIAFHEADLTRLQLADQSFKRVFSWGVIIHIPDMDAALRELVRVLQPGGRLALYVTNHRAWEYPALRLGRKLRGRPSIELTETPLGLGSEFESDGDRLWVWRVDVDGLTRRLQLLGLRRIARLPGNFSELHRRCGGVLRNALLHCNNIWYRFNMPAVPCITNLLIFEKPEA